MSKYSPFSIFFFVFPSTWLVLGSVGIEPGRRDCCSCSASFISDSSEKGSELNSSLDEEEEEVSLLDALGRFLLWSRSDELSLVDLSLVQRLTRLFLWGDVALDL